MRTRRAEDINPNPRGVGNEMRDVPAQAEAKRRVEFLVLCLVPLRPSLDQIMPAHTEEGDLFYSVH